jgi:hypothetical protein
LWHKFLQYWKAAIADGALRKSTQIGEIVCSPGRKNLQVPLFGAIMVKIWIYLRMAERLGVKPGDKSM